MNSLLVPSFSISKQEIEEKTTWHIYGWNIQKVTITMQIHWSLKVLLFVLQSENKK